MLVSRYKFSHFLYTIFSSISYNVFSRQFIHPYYFEITSKLEWVKNVYVFAGRRGNKPFFSYSKARIKLWKNMVLQALKKHCIFGILWRKKNVFSFFKFSSYIFHVGTKGLIGFFFENDEKFSPCRVRAKIS